MPRSKSAPVLRAGMTRARRGFFYGVVTLLVVLVAEFANTGFDFALGPYIPSPDTLFTANRSFPDNIFRTKRKLVLNMADIPDCEWRSSKGRPRSVVQQRIVSLQILSRLSVVLASYGIPLLYRNGNILAAYRKDARLNGDIYFDADLFLIVPSGQSAAKTLNLLNAIACGDFHYRELKGCVRFNHQPFSWLVFGSWSYRINGCVEGLEDEEDPWCEIDIVVLSEDFLFDNLDFRKQTKTLFDIELVESFSAENLCWAESFGEKHLAMKDPYQKKILEALYGPNFETSPPNLGVDWYYWSLNYPRWMFRTNIGRYLYCAVGNWLSSATRNADAVDGFLFSVSHESGIRENYRSANGTIRNDLFRDCLLFEA
eukprot:m.12632 g.12632  ORF g.12632 m.12632 type:complete len:371 (+) comp4693_c0_seq1:258-1370(+)